MLRVGVPDEAVRASCPTTSISVANRDMLINLRVINFAIIVSRPLRSKVKFGSAMLHCMRHLWLLSLHRTSKGRCRLISTILLQVRIVETLVLSPLLQDLQHFLPVLILICASSLVAGVGTCF